MAAILFTAFLFLQKPAVTPALADVVHAAQAVRSVHIVSRWMEEGFSFQCEFWAAGNKWRKTKDGVLWEVCDGKTVYHFQPSRRMAFTSPAKRGSEMVYEMATGLDLDQLNEAVRQGDLLVNRQQVTFRGRPYLLVRITDKEQRFRYMIYADPQTRLAMHAYVEAMDDSGCYRTVWVMDQAEYNTGMDDRLFTPQIPKGWQVREWTPPLNPYARTTSLPAVCSGFNSEFRDGSYTMGSGYGQIYRDLSVTLLDVRLGDGDTLVVRFKTRGLNHWAEHDLFMRGICVADSDTWGQATAFVAGGGPDDPPERDLSVRDGVHAVVLRRVRGFEGDMPSVVDVMFTMKAKKGSRASNCWEEDSRLPEPWLSTPSIRFQSVPITP